MAKGTPEQIREQKRRYRKRYPDKRRAERDRYRTRHPEQRVTQIERLKLRKIQSHRFLAIDGEGWNDANGSHNYHMIVTSDPELYISTIEPLTTVDSLRFIGSLPVRSGEFIVSFFFDYDVTMILRDFAREEPTKCGTLFVPGQKDYVWYRGIGIKYVPHKHLTVKLPNRKPVTVHDTQGYFQSSFVVALKKFDIGDSETVARIESMKSQRSSFTPSDRESVLAYSQDECRLLVQLIERVRDRAVSVGLNPSPYEGPGGLASRALAKHYGKTTHLATLERIPERMKPIIPLLLYGGRFETLACGFIPAEVHEYDRHSAYPAIMSDLPCLVHGKWIKSQTREGRYAFAHITFRDVREPDYGIAYGLPIRRSSGALHYPRTGGGWYWQHEYTNIPTLEYTFDNRWVWVPDGCSCRPFTWVRDMFAQREQMEAEHKGSGIVLKLTLNTLYGKCAQTKPTAGAWCNLLYASIITSELRTDMYRLYRACKPMTVLMFATDAIFTTDRLPVSHGLGGLELASTYRDLTIVQPGLYFDVTGAHFKSRGIPKRYVQAFGDEICVASALGVDYPMKVTQFRGMRLCLANGHLDRIGQWDESFRMIGTRQLTKRTEPINIGGILYTAPAENRNADGESVARDDTDVILEMMLSDAWNEDEGDYE